MKRYSMKFASLFLVVVTVLSFSACSDDDGPGTEESKEPVEAYLSVAAMPDLSTRTRSEATTTEKEVFIEKLTAFVFTENNVLHAVKSESSQKDSNGENVSVSEVREISVKVIPNYNSDYSETKFKVVLLANSEIDINEIQTLEDLYSKVSSSSTSSIEDYLPMSSGVLTISNINWKDASKDKNWISKGGGDVTADKPGVGSEIELKRLVARVELAGVKLDLDKYYSNAEFLVDSVYLVNVRTKAHYIINPISDSEGDDESVEYKQSGYFRGGPVKFTTIDKLIANDGTGDDDPDNYSTYKDSYSTVFAQAIKLGTTENVADFASCKYYVYPSSLLATNQAGYETRLVLSCRYRFSDKLDYIRKYFHIVIGKDGLQDAAAMGVLNNNVYGIHVTITGEGSPNPDEYIPNSYLTIKLEVQPWTVVHQTEKD